MLKKKGKKTIDEITVAVIAGISTAFILWLLKSAFSYHSMKKEEKDFLKKSRKINERLETLETQFDTVFRCQISNSAVILPTENFKNSLSYSYESNDYMTPLGGTEDKMLDDDIAAKSVDGKTLYTYSDIKNKRVLVPYTTEDGKEVYFCGFYNERNHWDGDCIINVYKNRVLVGVTEASFKDGERVSYKQLIPGKNTWNYNERVCEGEKNHGITKNFKGRTTFEQSFDKRQVKGENIYTVGEFMSRFLDKDIKDFYYGDTSNGTFNDASGKSYYVSYDDDGNILTLYYGGFVDGKFNDKSNNAWYITRLAKDPTKQSSMKYMYCKGIFENGELIKPDKGAKTNLTIAEINEYLKDVKIKAPLRWHNT